MRMRGMRSGIFTMSDETGPGPSSSSSEMMTLDHGRSRAHGPQCYDSSKQGYNRVGSAPEKLEESLQL